MRQASPLNNVVRGMSRRDFMQLCSLSALGLVTGCATNPVTGQSQLMLVSEDSEIQVDQQNSPHQLSTDYGVVQDKRLNSYVQGVGQRLAPGTHRPHMPYSFNAVNATYINAYAFPGGTIAATRGILLSLDNEAELAALMGHELGHVNARHTARQMSKGMVTQMIVGGLAAYAGTKGKVWGDVAAQLGMLGAGALLASYSRENEREADDLGMRYMVQSGYGTGGMVGLMDMLKSLSHKKASTVELLFSTHPMSDERYDNAVTAAEGVYADGQNQPIYRDRYKDNLAGLRKIKGAIQNLQQGEQAMGQKQYPQAESFFRKALKQAPNDYAGLVMMSKCQLAQKNNRAALRYAEKAKRVNPQEAQALHLAGYAKTQAKQFASAYEDFNRYDRLLPGNPTTLFFKAYALDGMQRDEAAAEHYYQYLQAVNEGDQAQYAYNRLVKMGYIKSE